MIDKSHRWRKNVVAAAAIALLGFSATEVAALSLGRISVQSSLGEALRAEIDVPSITAEEAATLRANPASPAAFVAAGLEYNAVMTGLQATLARRPDGRAYIKLSSDRPINDPFVDMILEATWSSGRIVRDFTMLFDPPSLKQPVAPAPTLPQVAAPAPTPVAVPAKPVAPQPAPEVHANTPAKQPAASAAPAAPVAKAPVKAESSNAQQVVVKPGDSASKIALSTKASDVSLDQMLVALIRSNPDAFSQGNLNRLRSGAVLNVPSSEQAKSVPTAEASQIVVAQSKDFNEFRRNLATNAPKTAVEAPNRKATGSVDAKVEDKKAAAAAADKLTLSKGAVKSKAEEAKIAKERADAEAATRAAELAKNIEDLKKLSSASAKAPAAPAAPASTAQAAPAVPVAAPKLPASEPAPAPVATPVASAPAVAASKPAAPVAPPVPAPEPSLVDQLLEDPTLPLAGGGLLALLGGYALYRRIRARKAMPTVDSSFLESKMPQESFFGGTGGQQVDTSSDGTGGSSSMGYSNGATDAHDDVDPVAEADVYLAYGRDMQAEDILKAALPANPERLAIHTKLLEIYAKRKDTASYQTAATTALALAGADSPDWARICETGLTIDPENPLYQPGGSGDSESEAAAPEAADDTQATLQIDAQPAAASTDLDLDLDFSSEEFSSPAPLSPAASEVPPEAAAAVAIDTNQLDFDVTGADELTPLTAEVESEADKATEPGSLIPEMSLDLGELGNLELEAPGKAEAPVAELPDLEPLDTSPAPVVPPAVSAKSDDGMLEFDLGSLSLDLGDVSGPAGADASAEPADNSLETKLALAEEFVSIGDHDGARALIEEVVAEASGDLRERAQRALANLS